MRRRLALLLTATSLAFLGGVALAGSASAGRDGPNSNSLYGQCTSAAAGKHLGWSEGADTERRNVGGACPTGPR